MNGLRKDARGQFVIVAALLIALLTLSLALSIHQSNLNRQQLSYEPVQELVLGITSDLDRCLTRALSIATQRFYYSGWTDRDNATNGGNEFISKWIRSVLASYSQLGLKINTNQTVEGLTDFSWNIQPPGKTKALSQVSGKFDLDIDALGFKGWVGRSGKFVSLELFPTSIQTGSSPGAPLGITTLKFQIEEGKDQPSPIPNVTPEFMNILEVTISDVSIRANITDLNYLGDGIYAVTFTPRIDEHIRSVYVTVVTPEDNIYVTAYLDKKENPVTLQSAEENLTPPGNLGQVQLGDTIFDPLPSLTAVFNGTYFLRYFPASGYIFLNWTTTGDINVTNPISSTTSATVNGNGTITAFYRYCTVSFHDRYWDGSGPDIGSITLGNSPPASLPNTTSLTLGDYSLQYTPNGSDVFLWWESFGAILTQNSNPTTLRVIGDGNVTAVYGSEPLTTLPNSVTLQSMDENLTPPGNLGEIQLEGTLFNILPSLTRWPNGTYALGYAPPNGYAFINWTVNGLAAVLDPNSTATTITINGDCTVTAFYRKLPAAHLILDSKLSNPTVTPYTIAPIADSWVEYNSPDVNHGSDQTIHTRVALPNFRWIYVKFDLSSFPSDAVINSVRLYLYGKVTAPTTLPSAYEVADDSWNETGITWNNKPLPGAWVTDGTQGNGNWYEWDITSYARSEFAIDQIISVVLKFKNESLTPQHIDFISREGTSNQNPWLEIFCPVAPSNSADHLGIITVDTNNYTLPNAADTAFDNYSLHYWPQNSSYVFLWWEFDGGVIPWNSASENTTLTVFGDGNVTAVYGPLAETPPPFVGDWNILYLGMAPGPALLPQYLWIPPAGKPALPAPPIGQSPSTTVDSPPSPLIVLAQHVNVSIYVVPDPPGKGDMTVELGFISSNGTSYTVGTHTFGGVMEGWYTFRIDSKVQLSIPEGSVITLRVSIAFKSPTIGTFYLIYGANYPSRIELA